MIRRPPRSTQSRSSAASDVYKRQVHNVCRGNSIDVKGKYISEILSKLKRQILDVEVEISFKRRKYNGKEKLDTERFRLVAIFNEEEEKYHVYLTLSLIHISEPTRLGMISYAV